MLRLSVTSLLVALLFPAPADLVAQQEPAAPEAVPVKRGDRVRITAPGVFLGRIVGTVVALTPDSCFLDIEGRADTAVYALASLKGLEVVRGQKSYWSEGAAVGVVAGMLIGYTISSYPGGAPCVVEIADRCIATGISLAGGGLGFLIGADLGRRQKRDRWERVPLERIRVGLVPAPGGGLAASISIAF